MISDSMQEESKQEICWIELWEFNYLEFVRNFSGVLHFPSFVNSLVPWTLLALNFMESELTQQVCFVSSAGRPWKLVSLA